MTFNTFILLYRQGSGWVKIENLLSSFLNETMQKYGQGNSTFFGKDSDSINLMWDLTQQQFQCCGIFNYKEWYQTPYGNFTNVPDSCCIHNFKTCGENIISMSISELEVKIYTIGCLTTIESKQVKNPFKSYDIS